jgi:LysR family transcriptional regulator, regulator for metE and metH
MTRMDLEIRHLRLVVAIAETGSVTRAGERLFLTQSALSHQLRDIESRLNTPLFHRVGKRMVATTAGEELLRSARQVLEIVVRTEDGIKRAAGGAGGVLRLSTECYTCYHWLPAILKQYRAAHPDVDVRVDAAATPDPVKFLLEGRLDLAVMSTHVSDRRLAENTLFEDDMLVIMAPHHRLAARAYITPADFADETLLIYPPKEESTVFQRVLAPAGVTPAALQQVQLTEAIIELVKAGMGIAVLAGWAVDPYVRSGTLAARPLTRRGYRRRWSAVMLRDMASVPYVKAFVDLLARHSPVSADRRRTLGLLRFDRPARSAARRSAQR